MGNIRVVLVAQTCGNLFETLLYGAKTTGKLSVNFKKEHGEEYVFVGTIRNLKIAGRVQIAHYVNIRARLRST